MVVCNNLPLRIFSKSLNRRTSLQTYLRMRRIQIIILSKTRRLLGTILTVYIPTVLLIIISHMTNYFKPFFFEVFAWVRKVNRFSTVPGCCHSQLDRDVSACDHVHQRLPKSAKDLLHKDGRRLAHFQSDDSVL